MPLDKQAPGSRVADLALGAGSLLDIGMYTLTWESMIMHAQAGDVEIPTVTSSLILNKGVDEISTVVLSYAKKRAQAICTASYLYKTEPEFCRVEGTEGTIHILGRATSKPHTLIVRKKGAEEKKLEFVFEGWGFFEEADAAARDIRDGKLENNTMPLEETIRIMELMDLVRKQSGLRYPQDDQ
jgi:dihydrodiol dehydrogenase / D-xylose 1-dehydrogenase (NADP)